MVQDGAIRVAATRIEEEEDTDNVTITTVLPVMAADTPHLHKGGCLLPQVRRALGPACHPHLHQLNIMVIMVGMEDTTVEGVINRAMVMAVGMTHHPNLTVGSTMVAVVATEDIKVKGIGNRRRRVATITSTEGDMVGTGDMIGDTATTEDTGMAVGTVAKAKVIS